MWSYNRNGSTFPFLLYDLQLTKDELHSSSDGLATFTVRHQSILTSLGKHDLYHQEDSPVGQAINSLIKHNYSLFLIIPSSFVINRFYFYLSIGQGASIRIGLEAASINVDMLSQSFRRSMAELHPDAESDGWRSSLLHSILHSMFPSSQPQFCPPSLLCFFLSLFVLFCIVYIQIFGLCHTILHASSLPPTLHLWTVVWFKGLSPPFLEAWIWDCYCYNSWEVLHSWFS